MGGQDRSGGLWGLWAVWQGDQRVAPSSRNATIIRLTLSGMIYNVGTLSELATWLAEEAGGGRSRMALSVPGLEASQRGENNRGTALGALIRGSGSPTPCLS
jgi:hypothetical protein